MRRFLTPRWLVRHAVMIVLVTAFLALGWWQVTRAIAGNALSYGYAFEWPLFAAFVIFVWIREVRSELRPPPEPDAAPPPVARQPFRTRRVPPVPADDDDSDPALAAYNRYLAWLAANPDRRPSEYRS